MLFDGIKDTIGKGAANKDADLFATKKALETTGDYNPLVEIYDHPTSEPDTTLENTLSRYQGTRGLKQDGLMVPGGPTETLLRAETAEIELEAAGRDPAAKPLKLTQPIGPTQSNQPEDVSKLSKVFQSMEQAGMGLSGLLGTPPKISNFQEKFNLDVDDTMLPGGPTEAVVNRLAGPIQVAALEMDAGLFTPERQSDVVEELLPHLAGPEPNLWQLRSTANTYPPAAQVAQSTSGASSSPTGTPPPQQGIPSASTPGTAPQPPSQNTLPPIPSYTDASGNTTTRVSQKDWQDFHNAMDAHGVSPIERDVFGRIFSAEGGQQSDGTTVAGITAGFISAIHHDENKTPWLSKRLDALGVPDGTAPDTLSREQQIELYRAYMDQAIAPAKASKGQISGMDVLALRVQDPNTIAAIADTFFRVGSKISTPMIQNAINDTFQAMGSNQRVDLDKAVGTGNLTIIGQFAANPDTRKLFIDKLMDRRNTHYSAKQNADGEKIRSDSYRIP